MYGCELGDGLCVTLVFMFFSVTQEVLLDGEEKLVIDSQPPETIPLISYPRPVSRTQPTHTSVTETIPEVNEELEQEAAEQEMELPPPAATPKSSAAGTPRTPSAVRLTPQRISSGKSRQGSAATSDSLNTDVVERELSLLQEPDNETEKPAEEILSSFIVYVQIL